MNQKQTARQSTHSSSQPGKHLLTASEFTKQLVRVDDGWLMSTIGPQNEGPPVIFIHGYPDSHHVWRPTMMRLGGRCRVATYDVRGAGDSMRPTSKDAYSLKKLADDLETVAEQIFPGERPHLVAHDWGGIQSWEAVCRHGAEHRFASFTTLSGPALDHVGLWMREQMQRRSLKALFSQMTSSFYIGGLMTPALPTLLWRGGLSRLWRQQHDSESKTARFSTLTEDGIFGAKLYRKNVMNSLRFPRPIRTSVRTLSVGLQDDPYVKPELMEHAITYASDGYYTELAHDHWSIFEDPELLDSLLLDWIEHKRVATGHGC